MVDSMAEGAGLADDRILDALRGIIAPLVEADEGELYVLEARPAQVKLHLRGKFSGCPGNNLVAEEVILPVLRREYPEVILDVSSGPLVPDTAQRVHPSNASTPPDGA